MTRRLLPLLAALLVAIPAGAQKHDALKSKRAATWTAEPVHVTVPTTQPVAGEVDADVLRGLATMQILAAWIPDVGVPQVVALPQGAAIRRSVEGQVLYEASSATKLPMRGLAGEGEVTLRLWSWYRPGWKHAEFWVEVANDSPWHPCGGLEANGTWRFLLDTPGGYAIPRAVNPYMLTPFWSPARPSLLQVDFPRADLPDGCYRGAGIAVGWGQDAIAEAYRANVAPDHGAHAGVAGTIWDVDETRGVLAAQAWAREREAWLAKKETDPYSDFPSVALKPGRKHRRNHGAGGDDAWLFGQLPIAGLQEGGSDLAADYAILQVLAVEGRRPTWLDWSEIEAAGKGYFVPGKRGETFYEFYKIHRWSRPAFARGSWTDATFGDQHQWTGPNHEHRYNAALMQAASLTLHPVVRDKALQYAARAACACNVNGIDDGGYYGGGPITDYMREWVRQLSTEAFGESIARRWGMDALADKFLGHWSTKWRLAIEDPNGWLQKRGNDGERIPWCNTPMSFNVPNGSLRLEDIVGTVFDTAYYRNDLRHVNVTAFWQRNQLGPQVLLALRTQNVHALHGLRDLAWQLFESVLGPVGDLANLEDVGAIRIAKYGSTRVLGLGRGWQTDGAVPPIAQMQVIEGWTYETAAWAAVFEGQGVDPYRREQYRKALLSIRPDHEFGQWGCAPPARWVEYANAHGGIPQLGPVPVHTSVVAPR